MDDELILEAELLLASFQAIIEETDSLIQSLSGTNSRICPEDD